jgi:hypothetical protein
MFLIVRMFFIIVAVFFVMTIITGLSLALRIRQHLRNPFLKESNRQPAPPPGTGDIIEGEFKVLDEKRK